MLKQITEPLLLLSSIASYLLVMAELTYRTSLMDFIVRPILYCSIFRVSYTRCAHFYLKSQLQSLLSHTVTALNCVYYLQSYSISCHSLPFVIVAKRASLAAVDIVIRPQHQGSASAPFSTVMKT